MAGGSSGEGHWLFNITFKTTVHYRNDTHQQGGFTGGQFYSCASYKSESQDIANKLKCFKWLYTSIT